MRDARTRLGLRKRIRESHVIAMARVLVVSQTPKMFFFQSTRNGASAVVALMIFVIGCAHTTSDVHDVRAGLQEQEKVESSPATDHASADEAQAPIVARPRLARTVTLGEVDHAPSPSPVAGAGNAGGPTVIVNNVISVSSAPLALGYGGYGIRSSSAYGFRDGYGRGRSVQAWAPTGWEGAGRTARPGQTPNVAGNWAPAPSYGPRQMK